MATWSAKCRASALSTSLCVTWGLWLDTARQSSTRWWPSANRRNSRGYNCTASVKPPTQSRWPPPQGSPSLQSLWLQRLWRKTVEAWLVAPSQSAEKVKMGNRVEALTLGGVGDCGFVSRCALVYVCLRVLQMLGVNECVRETKYRWVWWAFSFVCLFSDCRVALTIFPLYIYTLFLIATWAVYFDIFPL